MGLVKLLCACVPIVIQQTCVLLVSTLTVAHVGHALGAEALAGFSLGNLTFNLLGLTIIIAPMIALESTAPQAYGAGRHSEVGLNSQRAILTAFAFLIPVSAVWLNAELVLLALGQPREVAAIAASFLKSMLPALPVQTVFETAKRFLYAQGITWPPVLAACSGVGGLLLWLGPLVEARGFHGATLALLLAHTTMLVVLLLYMRLLAPHEPATWPGLQPKLLVRDPKAMWVFIKTSVAGLVALSEWLFWEFVCFRAGSFGALPLAVHSVAYSCVPLAFMVPFGVSIALANGVGNALGEGDVPSARRMAFFATVTATALSVAYSVCVYAAGGLIIRSFTSDEQVV